MHIFIKFPTPQQQLSGLVTNETQCQELLIVLVDLPSFLTNILFVSFLFSPLLSFFFLFHIYWFIIITNFLLFYSHPFFIYFFNLPHFSSPFSSVRNFESKNDGPLGIGFVLGLQVLISMCASLFYIQEYGQRLKEHIWV